MRFVYALIALGIAAGMPTKTNAQTWDEYRPAGIGFRIEMPGKPQLETQKTKAGNTAYQAIVGFRDMAFLAIYGTKDEKSPADTNALLDAVVPPSVRASRVGRFEVRGLEPTSVSGKFWGWGPKTPRDRELALLKSFYFD